ncbi:MAG TPA: hypothetical protein VLB50_08775 [Ignavibacteriaceae bacterium]|nr:hypothetical protein [Ignavibacteriaceae bacterium]
MLRSAKEMEKFKIKAMDGEIGRLHEFYFDDHTWIVRYIIVDTGTWLAEKLVLISPESFKKLNWEDKSFNVNLDKQQIEDSPDVDKAKPVSRQNEIELIGYYGWPMYWTGIGGPTIGAFPPSNAALAGMEEEIHQMRKKEKKGDPNLRSTREVISYGIHASDGQIGHVEDFLIDDSTWNIRYMIVDTRNILPGKKVIMSPEWIEKIVWAESNVYLRLTKDEIKNSPEYDPSVQFKREYENKLYEYYGRRKYWENDRET